MQIWITEQNNTTMPCPYELDNTRDALTRLRVAILHDGQCLTMAAPWIQSLPQFAARIGADVRNLRSNTGVQLANDIATSVSQYGIIDVKVGGILCCLAIYLFGDGKTFDILLLQSW